MARRERLARCRPRIDCVRRRKRDTYSHEARTRLREPVDTDFRQLAGLNFVVWRRADVNCWRARVSISATVASSPEQGGVLRSPSVGGEAAGRIHPVPSHSGSDAEQTSLGSTLSTIEPAGPLPTTRTGKSAAACAAHTALGPTSLVMFDVAAYLETGAGDGFREPGFSQAGWLWPQNRVVGAQRRARNRSRRAGGTSGAAAAARCVHHEIRLDPLTVGGPNAAHVRHTREVRRTGQQVRSEGPVSKYRAGGRDRPRAHRLHGHRLDGDHAGHQRIHRTSLGRLCITCLRASEPRATGGATTPQMPASDWSRESRARSTTVSGWLRRGRHDVVMTAGPFAGRSIGRLGRRQPP
jgi:hypothetical protein